LEVWSPGLGADLPLRQTLIIQMPLIECHWAGGVITRHEVIRSARRFEQLANFHQLLARAVELRTAGTTAEQIAARLNAEGFRPAKRRAFDAPTIRRLLQRHGHGTTRPIWSRKVPRADEEEMTLQEVAERLGAHRKTVYGWLRRSTLKGRLTQVGKQRIWLVKLADSLGRRAEQGGEPLTDAGNPVEKARNHHLGGRDLLWSLNIPPRPNRSASAARLYYSSRGRIRGAMRACLFSAQWLSLWFHYGPFAPTLPTSLPPPEPDAQHQPNG
jgi:hypothetical protein